MNTAGKIYFWFLVALDLIAYCANMIHYSDDIRVLLLILTDLVLSVIVLYVFYGIVFNKPWKGFRFFKLFFALFIIWELLIFYIFQVRIQDHSSSFFISLAAGLVYLPEYVIVAVHAFGRKK